jgi:hypothetical protein
MSHHYYYYYYYHQHSQCLLFADDLKIYRSNSDVDDCKLLQHDIDSVQNWCLDDSMKLNSSKTTIISFTRKTNSIYFNYKLCNNLVVRSQCVKDLGVLLDCKLYFHQHINYIFSQSLKMLGLIRYITSSFSALDSLLVLYSTLVRSKIDYASVVWNSITSTDSAKLERIQRKFAALCYTRFFNGVSDYKYEDILVRFTFLTLHFRRRHFDALSLIHILKVKLVAHLFLILLFCVYSQGLLETILLLLYTVISRSASQPDVFLLPMQSVGALTYLIKIVFGLLISVSFLNKNSCSLSLHHLFVFNCFLLCFIFFNFSACL